MQIKYEHSGETFETDANQLSPKSLAYLINYGWRQALQDSMAGPRAKARADEKLAKGELDNDTVRAACVAAMSKRMASILAGELEPQSGKGRDPLRATARLIVETKLAEKGKTATKQKIESLVDDLLAKDPDSVRAEIAKRRANTGEDISLDDLMA